ncbi:WD40-repeat-containing domain protein, partial [Ochromonadaceae sp. CCMP2298]
MPPVTLDEHTAAVTRLRAPLRTNLLLSSSLDGTVRIWGPDGSTAGSRAVLDVAAFRSDSGAGAGAGGAYSEPRPERRIALGSTTTGVGAGVGVGVGAGVSTGAEEGGRGVRITNMWADESCETVWAACSDAALRVWSGGEGRALRLLRGHEDQITAMEGMDTSSPGASHLLQSSSSGAASCCLVATGSADRTVRIWDVRAKKAQVFSFRGHGDTVLALRWGEGGRSLVSGGKDKTVRIWDTRAGRLRVTLEKHFGSVSCLRVLNSAGGMSGGGGETSRATIISAGRDSMINAWSSSGDCLSSSAAHRGTVACLSEIAYGGARASYAGGGPLMLSTGLDGMIKLWDMRRFKCVSEISSAPSAPAPAPTLVGMGAQAQAQSQAHGNLSKVVWCKRGFVTGSSGGVVRLYESDTAPGVLSAGGGGGSGG